MRKRFTPPVAGGRHAHQPRIHLVLDVAAQNPILDQHGALRGRALIVDVERTPAPVQRTVVDDRDLLGRHLLPDPVRKGRRPLAIEVTLEPMADGLVEQDARPARTQYHRHRPRRRSDRIQIHERLTHRLTEPSVRRRPIPFSRRDLTPSTKA